MSSHIIIIIIANRFSLSCHLSMRARAFVYCRLLWVHYDCCRRRFVAFALTLTRILSLNLCDLQPIESQSYSTGISNHVSIGAPLHLKSRMSINSTFSSSLQCIFSFKLKVLITNERHTMMSWHQLLHLFTGHCLLLGHHQCISAAVCLWLLLIYRSQKEVTRPVLIATLRLMQ